MRVHAQFGYDIHGVITISSEVRLPELEAFMTAERVDDPTIDVRIGRNTRQWLESRDHDPEATPFRYSEGFGALGFRVDIELSSKVRILASPILRWSPHVLYTNVVEPILRWSLAARGYALVHGACLAYDDQAYLITARTDTGKTTTLLRILNHQRRASDKGAFLSDDLTLVSADKRVFTYPKPLTISSHTVAAIDTPLLSWRERIALIVQSRLHSRDGRRLALLLANTRLPMATINTIVQLLVPPPKFPVQRLVPRVKTVRESTLAGIFVIERGEDDELALQNETAYETLMSNSEDAYGFPPYQSIATFLHGAHKQDLVGTEREIVANALDGLPSFLIRSSQMDWAERITAFVAPSTARSPRAVAPVPDLVFGVGD